MHDANTIRRHPPTTAESTRELQRRIRRGIATAPTSNFITADGLRLHYLEMGAGDPVLLLHGWPTSSYLWRNVMPAIAERNRVIAPDLPGFGRSDKPPGASYSFRFHARTLTGLIDQLGIDRLGLAVHDLGGPIGLYWAVHHRDRVARLALLNTVVFKRPSWAVIAFVAASKTPGLRSLLVSGRGLRFAMRLGVSDKDGLGEEVIRAVEEPFKGEAARRALIRSAHGLHPRGFDDIERGLPELGVPVRVVYGEDDRILPDVKRTMAKVAQQVPGAEVTSLPGCGHFLQEDRPAEVGRLLAEFFAP